MTEQILTKNGKFSVVFPCCILALIQRVWLVCRRILKSREENVIGTKMFVTIRIALCKIASIWCKKLYFISFLRTNFVSSRLKYNSKTVLKRIPRTRDCGERNRKEVIKALTRFEIVPLSWSDVNISASWPFVFYNFFDVRQH